MTLYWPITILMILPIGTLGHNEIQMILSIRKSRYSKWIHFNVTNCNFPFSKFWRKVQFGQNSSLTSHDSRGFQLSPNGPKFEMQHLVWWVLRNPEVIYVHFEYFFIPQNTCLGLRRNNANLLGKCGQLVLLGLVPNTTKPFQNFLLNYPMVFKTY